MKIAKHRISHEEGILFVLILSFAIQFIFDSGFWSINEELKNSYISNLGTRIALLCFISFFFVYTKKSQVSKRSLWTVAILLQMLEIMSYTISFWYRYCQDFGYKSHKIGYYIYSHNLNDIGYYFYLFLLFIIFPIVFIRMFKRPYIFSIVPYDERKVYICFYKATRFKMIIFSIFGASVGSTAVYAGNHLYSYRYTDKKFMKRKIRYESIDKNYVMVDTKINFNEKLETILNDLVGTPARTAKTLWLRCMCLKVLKPFLAELGSEFVPSLFENNPSVYFNKLERIINNAE